MIPVFVISLPDSTCRRKMVSASLRELGLEFSFFDAVDGRSGLGQDSESKVDRAGAIKTGRLLADAEFACALSHLNVYRLIVDSGIEYALILEDDAIPFPDLVRYLEEKKYRNLDLTQLHFNRVIYVRRWGSRELIAGYRLYFRLPCVQVTSAVAYVISNRAARFFLKHALPVRKEADWPDCIEMLIASKQAGIVYPKLVGHPPLAPGQSIINLYGSKDFENDVINVKKKRRILGIYVPPWPKMVASYKRAPKKIKEKRLF